MSTKHQEKINGFSASTLIFADEIRAHFARDEDRVHQKLSEYVRKKMQDNAERLMSETFTSGTEPLSRQSKLNATMRETYAEWGDWGEERPEVIEQNDDALSAEDLKQWVRDVNATIRPRSGFFGPEYIKQYMQQPLPSYHSYQRGWQMSVIRSGHHAGIINTTTA